MKTYVVIPTYNEKENIEELLGRVFSLSVEDLHVLVVDDNSPDGTGALVEGLKERYPRLDVLHRKAKEGLGRAYIAAFKEVMSRGSDYIIQMDADLSHNPNCIPTFLKEAKTYDLVLGSRYVEGGGINNWSPLRRMISRAGNFYARALLSVPYRDLTGGFKCYQRKVLESIDLEHMASIAYNFQIETTYKAHQAGFSIKETPIVFTKRRHGKSKFNAAMIIEAFWKVIALRLKGVTKQ